MHTREENQEIERHKYFLSEKRGYDVGWDFAARDWEAHHSAEWRGAREGSSNGAGVRGEDSNAAVAVVAEGRPRGGRLRRWLERLFFRARALS